TVQRHLPTQRRLCRSIGEVVVAALHQAEQMKSRSFKLRLRLVRPSSTRVFFGRSEIRELIDTLRIEAGTRDAPRRRPSCFARWRRFAAWPWDIGHFGISDGIGCTVRHSSRCFWRFNQLSNELLNLFARVASLFNLSRRVAKIFRPLSAATRVVKKDLAR